MPDIKDLMAEDAESGVGVGVSVPRDEDFRSIADLIQDQLRLQGEVAQLEEQLSDRKKELAGIQRGRLPEALAMFGMSMFKLDDGRIVEVSEDIHAGISAANLDDALTYLRSTGNDDIIKNDVDLTFGKGQEEEAKLAMQMLGAAGFSYKNKQYVHPMTLKSFVRTQLEAGMPIPTETFSIFVEKVAKIKEPRKSKY